MDDIKSVWDACRAKLDDELPKHDFTMWIAPIQPAKKGDTLELYVPNKWVAQKVAEQYLDTIRDVVKALGAATTVELIDGVLQEEEPKQAELLALDAPLESPDEGPIGIPNRRGASSLRVIEQAQGQLFNDAVTGKFATEPLDPGSEFPSILTRVPIFKPVRRTAAQSNVEGGTMEFATPWGEGKKIGPMLTTYDEDTLLALTHQRQIQIMGKAQNLPIGITDVTSMGDDSTVHTLFTTVGEIENYLAGEGKSRGGADYKRRLESLNRLNRTLVEFKTLHDRTEELFKSSTINTKLVDVMIREMDDEAVLYVQFPPIITLWLSQSYTYIDLKIRSELGDTGKAIHRALSGLSPGLGRPINIGVRKLQDITGSKMPNFKFNQALRQTLEKLEELGWIKDVEITGNGRRKPLVLIAKRTKKPRTPLINGKTDQT